MTEERYINDMLACLRAERDRRPDMQAEDIVKYIFQGMLGVGHLLGSRTSGEAMSKRRRSCSTAWVSPTPSAEEEAAS